MNATYLLKKITQFNRSRHNCIVSPHGGMTPHSGESSPPQFRNLDPVLPDCVKQLRELRENSFAIHIASSADPQRRFRLED
jgi:hypothetical protein